jgi:hypothetical protein
MVSKISRTAADADVDHDGNILLKAEHFPGAAALPERTFSQYQSRWGMVYNPFLNPIIRQHLILDTQFSPE